VATENKETKPRNVQLDNNTAVIKLPDDEGRFGKMANWVKKKVGMRINEGDDEHAIKGKLSKYLSRSIDAHDNTPEPPKYEVIKERANISSNLFKSFNIPGLGSDQSAKELSKKKKEEKKKNDPVPLSSEIQDEITTIKKKYNKHATSEQREAFWKQRKKYVDQYMPRLNKPFCNFAD